MDSRQRTGHPSRVRVYGPLAPYADGFRQYLAAQGYHPQVIGRQARLMADLSIWLEGQGRSGDELVAGLEAARAPPRGPHAQEHRPARGTRAAVLQIPRRRRPLSPASTEVSSMLLRAS